MKISCIMALEKQKQRALEAEYNKKHKELHAKIAKVEKQLDREGLALEEVTHKLIDIAELRVEEIRKLQIAAHQHQQTLDLGYQELELLIAELDLLHKAKP